MEVTASLPRVTIALAQCMPGDTGLREDMCSRTLINHQGCGCTKVLWFPQATCSQLSPSDQGILDNSILLSVGARLEI